MFSNFCAVKQIIKRDAVWKESEIWGLSRPLFLSSARVFWKYCDCCPSQRYWSQAGKLEPCLIYFHWFNGHVQQVDSPKIKSRGRASIPKDVVSWVCIEASLFVVCCSCHECVLAMVSSFTQYRRLQTLENPVAESLSSHCIEVFPDDCNHFQAQY